MRKEYFEKLSNESSKQTFLTVANKIEDYERKINKDFLLFNDDDFITFFHKYYSNKTAATLCNTISMMRKIYSFYEKDINHINIKVLRKNNLNIKEQSYFSPSEIKEVVDSLQNAQDKALVVLIYMGFYDQNFNTIRNIRKDQVFLDTLVFDEGIEINLSAYIEEILNDAVLEEYNYKPDGDTYDLNETEFLFRGRVSKRKDPLSSVTLKKRLKAISEFLDLHNFTAVKIKNSRTLYDLVKVEMKRKEELKRHEIRNFCVMNDVKGSIELLERKLKEMRGKIQNDILNKKDSFLG